MHLVFRACEKEGRAAFKCFCVLPFPIFYLWVVKFSVARFVILKYYYSVLTTRVYNIFVKLVWTPSINLGLHTMEVGLVVQYWSY